MNQQPEITDTTQAIDLDYLANLTPLTNLEQERLQELSKHIRVKSLSPNTTLFKRGDDNQVVYYLLAGEIDLIVNTANITLSSTSPQAMQPVDPHNPRHFTAVTRTPVVIIEINRDVLDTFVTRNQQDSYCASKIKKIKYDNNENMGSVLRSNIFQMIPPTNIQLLLDKFETVTYKKNQIVFRQDSDGDNFYLIKSGSCAVLRYKNPKDGWHVVADLLPGTGFGEESIITQKKRNATVIMSSDGTLLRLSREDFNQLIKTPIVKMVSYENALELVDSGVVAIDVSEAGEESVDIRFPNAIAIPMSKIRASLEAIPKNRPLLIYSYNELHSACAAYILISHGFRALTLRI